MENVELASMALMAAVAGVPIGYCAGGAAAFVALCSALTVLWLRRRRAVSEEAASEKPRRRLLEEALQGAQLPVLASVFDAFFICDKRGTVVASTPHADQLLGTGAVLEGHSLPDYGPGGEEARLRSFLLGTAAAPSAVARLHTSLRPLRREPLEATLTGVALPAAAASGPLLFVGVQILQEAVPLEPEAPTEALARRTCGSRGGAWSDPSDGDASPARAAGDLAGLCALGLNDGGGEADAKSHFSAPPVMAAVARSCLCSGRGNPTQDGGECSSGGDCLPPDAKVCVEGKAVPLALDKVEAGQRVLCYDHLSGGMKFAAVRDVDVKDASQTEWVEVTLADGAKLEMTVDHPIFIASDEGNASTARSVVRAGELQAGLHRLERLKVVSVEIADVKRLSGEDVIGVAGVGSAPAPTERVSLSVQQPERHSIFVCSSSTPDQGIAVGSSDAEVGPHWHWSQCPQSNTFINAPPDSPAAWRADRRLKTAPSELCPAYVQVTFADCGRSNKSVRSSAASAASHPESVASAVTDMSMLSRASSQWGHAEFVLSAAAPSASEPKVQLSSQVRLSDVAAQQKLGLKSVGSKFHALGVCSPCLMNHWSKPAESRNEPCKFGALCGRCHQPHSEGEFKKLQKALRRRVRGQPQATHVRSAPVRLGTARAQA